MLGEVHAAIEEILADFPDAEIRSVRRLYRHVFFCARIQAAMCGKDHADAVLPLRTLPRMLTPRGPCVTEVPVFTTRVCGEGSAAASTAPAHSQT